MTTEANGTISRATRPGAPLRIAASAVLFAWSLRAALRALGDMIAGALGHGRTVDLFWGALRLVLWLIALGVAVRLTAGPRRALALSLALAFTALFFSV